MVKPETGGLWWTKSKSMFYRSSGTFILRPLLLVMARGLFSDLVPVNISLITYFSKKVNLTPAVIQSFTSLSAFTTAFAFYILYRERLHLYHILGMILIIISVVIVSVSKSMEQAYDITDYLCEGCN